MTIPLVKVWEIGTEKCVRIADLYRKYIDRNVDYRNKVRILIISIYIVRILIIGICIVGILIIGI